MKFPEREKMRERAKVALRAVLGQFADVVISGIADYLLEEGALFPPVKIGQTVYAVLDEDEVLIDEWQVHGISYKCGEWLVLDQYGAESRIGDWDCLLTREDAEMLLAKWKDENDEISREK